MMSANPDEKIDGPYVNTTIFTATERLNTGESHSFRLEIPLRAYPLVSRGEKELLPVPVGGPFVFDSEVPVLPAPHNRDRAASRGKRGNVDLREGGELFW